MTFSYDDLLDLKVNETRWHSGVCVPTIIGTQGGSGLAYAKDRVSFPNNNEFELVVGDNCNMNSNVPNYGEELNNPAWYQGTIGGWRAGVKRKRYNANESFCCATGNKNFDKNTCDPKWSNRNSNDCQPHMRNYCFVDNKGDYLNKPECNSWLNETLPKNVDESKINLFCSWGNNVIGEFCKANKTVGMDKNVEDYCKRNPTDTDFCGCYNLPEDYKTVQTQLQAKGQTLIPWCNLTQCASNTKAYRASTNKDAVCPSQTICLNNIQVGSANTANLEGVSLSCDQTTTTLTTPAAKPVSDDLISKAKEITKTNSNNTIYYIIGIVILFILFGGSMMLLLIVLS